MSAIEIILLLAGALVLAAGYLIPSKEKESDSRITVGQEKKIEELVKKAVDDAKGKIEDIVDETVSYSVEKTERTMERISNEKIMAIQEYSDTVLEEINKNHEEEVFLYDMLNSKHDSLVETVSEAGKTVAEVKQTLQDAQLTAAEAKETVQTAKVTAETVKETAQTAKETVQTAKETAQAVDKPSNTGFAPMKPDSQIEVERVIPTFAETMADDPNVQLEEIIKKSIKAGKKKKAAAGTKKTQATAEELPTKDEETAKNMNFPGESVDDEEFDSSDYTPEEEAEFIQYGANRMSPDIQLNKGPALGGNNNEHILEMHRMGKSNMAIAKELGLGLGEVKLVIDLYKGMGK